MSDQDHHRRRTADDSPDHPAEAEDPLGPTRIQESLHTDDPGEGTTGAPPAAGADATTHVGRYRLVGKLGEGGFGSVFLAHDDSLNRPVAVKILKRPRAAGGAVERESAVLASLRHPSIAEVYDAGTDPEGRVYIVTRCIDGEPLSRVLTRGPVEPLQAARWARQIADALQYAHSQGITHRDIKPANLMITRDGDAVVLDFGVAMQDSDVRSAVDYSGTPAWMSPEQAAGQGRRIDGRSDLFSLGTVLYEMLTGVRAFRGQSAVETLALIQTTEPRPPRQIRADIPQALERVCLKCLAKDPQERFATASDLAMELDAVIRRQSARRLAAGVQLSGAVAGLAAVVLIPLVVWRLFGGPATGDSGESVDAAQPDPAEAVLNELRDILRRRERTEARRRAGISESDEEDDAGVSPLTGPGKIDDASIANAPVPALPAGYEDLEERIQRAVEAGDRDEEFSALLKASNQMVEDLHYAIAEQVGRRMVAISVDDASGYPIACGQLGLALYKRGQFDDAILWLKKSTERYQALYDMLSQRSGEQAEEFHSHMARMLGIAWMRIGNAHKFARRYGDAGEAYRTALRLYEQHDRDAELLSLLLNFGSMESQNGNHITGMSLLNQGLDVADRLDDSQARAELLVNLANAESRNGHQDRAVEHFEQATELARGLDAYDLKSKLLLNYATTLLEMDRPEDAREKLEELQAIVRPGDRDAEDALELLPRIAGGGDESPARP